VRVLAVAVSFAVATTRTTDLLFVVMGRPVMPLRRR